MGNQAGKKGEGLRRGGARVNFGWKSHLGCGSQEGGLRWRRGSRRDVGKWLWPSQRGEKSWSRGGWGLTCGRSRRGETCKILEELGNSGRRREPRRETGHGLLKTRRCLDSHTGPPDGESIANPEPWARVPGEPQLTAPAPAGRASAASAAPPLPPPPQRLAPSSSHPRAPSSLGASPAGNGFLSLQL